MSLRVLTSTHCAQLLTITVAISLLVSCKRQPCRDNEISKIEIAVSGPMPNMEIALSIDSSHSYHYYGNKENTPLGYYEGRISKGFWDTLNMRLERIHFKQLDTTYNISADSKATEIIIYWKNHKKHLYKDISLYPDSISDVFNWIANSYKRTKLKPAKDTFKFETTYQLPPPTPKFRKGFRFSPPQLDIL